MVRQGRIGKLQRVDVVLGKNITGGPFDVRKPPGKLNWDMWQGQTPDVPYIEERCHYTFRWWYEYSGGQMTDWGAHHVDIAQWGIGSLPVEVSSVAKLPDVPNGYNVPLDFQVNVPICQRRGDDRQRQRPQRRAVHRQRRAHPGQSRHGGRQAGRRVEGAAARARDRFTLYTHDNLSRPERSRQAGRDHQSHGQLLRLHRVSRKQPLSDVGGQHQSINTCHLANISMRLGRPLKWDPDKQQIIDDSEANGWLRRQQRAGYEVG